MRSRTRRPATTADRVGPGLRAAPDERLLLGDPLPLAGQEVTPHLVGIPGQPRPCRAERPEAVVEHLAAGDFGKPLLRHRKPVAEGQAARRRVDAELAAQPRADVQRQHSMVDRPIGAVHMPNALVRHTEVCGISAQLFRQPLGE